MMNSNSNASHSKDNETLRRNKKDEVLGNTAKQARNLPLIVAAVVIMVAVAGAGIWSMRGGGQTAVETATITAPATSDEISLAAADFADGQARHFSLATSDGVTVRYFVVRSPDGVIRAAFDACDVCWRAGKGYTQSGDVMVCNNCGRRFATNKVNEVQGGCNPAPLKREMVDGRVIIKKANIEEGRRYFNLAS